MTIYLMVTARELKLKGNQISCVSWLWPAELTIYVHYLHFNPQLHCNWGQNATIIKKKIKVMSLFNCEFLYKHFHNQWHQKYFYKTSLNSEYFSWGIFSISLSSPFCITVFSIVKTKANFLLHKKASQF